MDAFRETLRRSLGRRPGPRGRRRLAVLAILTGALLVASTAAAVAAKRELAAIRSLCTLDGARAPAIGRTSFVYAADGSLLGAVPAEIARQPVGLDAVSPWVVRATLAIEDRRFFQHHGIDYRGIARAAVRNVRALEWKEGASTLTQQLARRMFLDDTRTLGRKRREACFALRLEEEWSKERILEEYLNRVFYGNRAYGIEAAARIYFGVHASELGPVQAALLAGLVQAPTAYDPLERPGAARARRDEVLRALGATGALPAARVDAALRRGLGLRPSDVYSEVREPAFFDHVRDLLVRRYGEAAVRRGGLRVHTTLDPRLQRLATQAIRRTLGRKGDPSTAIVAIDPRTGAIRALAAATPGARLAFNLAVDARRQAGSTFKTFVLAEAIRRGANPYATRYDSRRFDHDGWRPVTYDRREYGPSTLAEATLRSDNLVFAKLTLDLGPRYVAAMARALGVRSPLEPVPSIGLGSNEATPLDLASAYATLAAGGVYREPFAIRDVVVRGRRQDGWGAEAAAHGRVIPAGVAYEVSRLLRENVERGTGTAARLSRPAAGKTGTTDDHADAWFAGYVPQLATAVWVGYPKRARPMLSVRGVRVTGGTFPAQIWQRFMAPAVEPLPVAGFPGAEARMEWRPWTGARSLERAAAAATLTRSGRPLPADG